MATTAAFALALAACSGKQPDPTFDTSNADDLAHDMIPAAEVLPGTGWKLVAEDAPDGASQFELVDSDACKASEQYFQSLDQLDERESAGHAQREFALAEENVQGLPLALQVETEIYDDEKFVDTSVKSVGEIFAREDVQRCMADVFAAGAAGDGIEVSAETGQARAMAPRHGSTFAIEGTLKVADATFDVRMEMYWWRIGNAVVTVMVTGSDKDITAEFVKSLLGRVDGSAIVAARS